jgi:hypothetical protein
MAWPAGMSNTAAVHQDEVATGEANPTSVPWRPGDGRGCGGERWVWGGPAHIDTR